MNLLVSTGILLIALVAGMFLLAVARKENYGNLFTRTAWLVIIVAALLVVMNLARVTKRIACRTGICPPQYCQPHNNRMLRHVQMMNCCMGDRDMKKCCDEKMEHHGCKDMDDDEEDDDDAKASPDSLSK